MFPYQVQTRPFPFFLMCLTSRFEIFCPQHRFADPRALMQQPPSVLFVSHCSRWDPMLACSFIDSYLSFIQSSTRNFQISLRPFPPGEGDQCFSWYTYTHWVLLQKNRGHVLLRSSTLLSCIDVPLVNSE